MKKLLLILLIIFSTFTLVSCSKDDNNDINNDNNGAENGGSQDNNDSNDQQQTTPSCTHSYSETYKTNSSSHYYECSLCGNKKDEETHSLSFDVELDKITCGKCGYVYAETAEYENLDSLGVNPEEANNAYQVLVYSFYDADGDGYGDLKGLESKLDYIKDLGMNIIWLSPIMECESYHAYDITSFYRIDPKIGTMEDYLSLVNTAHEKGIKIMLDMPINHTSVNHEWFKEFLKGNPTYSEYYQERKPGVQYGTSSAMGETATFYTDTKTGKTYFGAFGSSMPDLNFQSQQLQDAIFDVFEYWVNLGADGFRFDAVKHIYDPNEIPSHESSVNLNWKFFKKLREYLKEISPNVYLLGENFSGQTEVLQYATAFDAEFDFDAWHTSLGAVTNADPWGAGNRRIYYDDTIVYNANELKFVNPNWINTFMTGNHDVNRAASYIGDKVKDKDAALKLYAAMIMLRSGIPFVYYGDEIGMYGENKSKDGFVEDSELRLPMNFADSTIDVEKVFYSVATNGKTLGQNILTDWPNFNETNPVVETEMAKADSLYNVYKSLIAYRSANPVIYKGTMEQVFDLSTKGTIISFTLGTEKVYVAFNFSETAIEAKNIGENISIDYFVNGATVSSDKKSLTLAERGVAVFTADGELTKPEIPAQKVTLLFTHFSDEIFANGAYCYAWQNGGSSNAAWPGVKMNDAGTNDYGQKLYSIEIDLAEFDNVIFSNGNGIQSVDFSLSGVTSYGFYYTGEKDAGGKYILGNY